MKGVYPRACVLIGFMAGMLSGCSSETPPPYSFSEQLLASGNAVWQAHCAVCHATGLAGAPAIGDEQAWAGRIAKGKDALLETALTGFRNMPARGGNPDLTDAEVAAAIAYMISSSW